MTRESAPRDTSSSRPAPARLKTPKSEEQELLLTKMQFPCTGSRIVQRRRLTSYLDGCMRRGVTFLTAPAGYGKTTLLGEWLSHLSPKGMQASYVALDSYDKSPVSFWSYVVAALSKVHPLTFSPAREAEKSPRCFEDSTRLNPLLNEISQVPRQLCLILDNSDILAGESVCDGLDYLIAHLPQNLHVLLSGRHNLSLPSSRLVNPGMSGQLGVLDLTFTLDEASMFLLDVADLDLHSEKIAQLTRTTEGWPYGLMLAARALKDPSSGHPGRNCSLNAEHAAFDRLVDEHLKVHSSQVRQFAVKTSILDIFDAELCDAVLGSTNSQDVLDQLEQGDIFLVPIDTTARSYRYHTLFKESLRRRLAQAFPDELPRLHRRAFEWLQAHGRSPQAVSHALGAGEIELAAQTAKSCVAQTILADDASSPVRWISCFSPELLRLYPELGIYYADANLLLGHFDQVEYGLKLVEQLVGGSSENDGPAERQLRWELSAIRTALGCVSGALGEGCVVAEPPGADLAHMRILVSHFSGYAYFANGSFNAAADCFETARQHSLKGIFASQYVYSNCEVARARKAQGRLREAERRYLDAIEYAASHLIDPAKTFLAITGLAEIALERNDFEAAGRWILDGITQFAMADSDTTFWAYWIVAASRVASFYLAQGEIKKSRLYFHRACKSLRDHSHISYRLFPEIADLRINLWLKEGDTNAAMQWLRRRTSDDAVPLSIVETLGAVRVYLALRQPEEALRLLQPAEETLRNSESRERLLDLLILKSLALDATHKAAAAVACATEAVAVAEQDGYIARFVREGKPMQKILERVVLPTQPHASATAFLRAVLAAFEPGRRSSTAASHSGIIEVTSTSEPLSRREREVLRIISEGKNAKDVAILLGVSVNTAKCHLKSIYRKLNVHSHAQVAEIAQDLGIVKK